MTHWGGLNKRFAPADTRCAPKKRGVVDLNHMIAERIAETARTPTGTLCYIGGVGRSGSTLLDFLLGGSPDVAALGEAHRLTFDARTGRDPCACGAIVARCAFWRAVETAAISELNLPASTRLLTRLDPMIHVHPSGAISDAVEAAILLGGHRAWYRAFADRVTGDHRAALVNSLFWYEMVRRVSGARIVVDSTKDARRMKGLFLEAPQSFRLLHLVRDGRAVAASSMRRLGVGMRAAAREWKARDQGCAMAAASIPSAQKITVRYEDLCEYPTETLSGVCSFLGVTFSPALLTVRRSGTHSLGGNPMRYRTAETSVRLDEQWKQQLTASDLQAFETVAGSWNRQWGYS